MLFSLIVNSPHPAIQQVPIPRATTAACDVIPPLTVKIPLHTIIPSISSGDVSNRTKINSFSPFLANSCALAAEKTTFPVPAPGDAGNPFAIDFASFNFLASKFGCNSCSNCFGSTFKTASSLVINPSFSISTAIFKAAFAVLFPFLVCRIYNLPCSIVNSISCISL